MIKAHQVVPLIAHLPAKGKLTPAWRYVRKLFPSPYKDLNGEDSVEVLVLTDDIADRSTFDSIDRARITRELNETLRAADRDEFVTCRFIQQSEYEQLAREIAEERIEEELAEAAADD